VLDRGGAEDSLFRERTLPHNDGCVVQPSGDHGSLLWGHNISFEFLGGAPDSIFYDNAKLAVAQNPERRPVAADAAVQRAWVPLLFADRSRPAQFLVPIPQVASFAELKARLLECCPRWSRRTGAL
jgi:hypothetical protein